MRFENPGHESSVHGPFASVLFFLFFLCFPATALVSGCASSPRYYSPAAEGADFPQRPPAYAAEPADQDLLQTDEDRMNAMDQWSRNLQWHGRMLGVDVGSQPSILMEPSEEGVEAELEEPPEPVERVYQPAPHRAEDRRVRRRSKQEHCRQAFHHKEAVCRAAERICSIADDLKESGAYERCEWARNECRKARDAYRDKC